MKIQNKITDTDEFITQCFKTVKRQVGKNYSFNLLQKFIPDGPERGLRIIQCLLAFGTHNPHEKEGWQTLRNKFHIHYKADIERFAGIKQHYVHPYPISTEDIRQAETEVVTLYKKGFFRFGEVSYSLRYIARWMAFSFSISISWESLYKNMLDILTE